MKGVREIAARSLQGLDEGVHSQFCKMRERILAIATDRPIGAMPLMQEKIFAAERGNAGRFKNLVGERFIRGQCRCGSVVLRIPRTSPGTELNAFGFRRDADQEPRS